MAFYYRKPTDTATVGYRYFGYRIGTLAVAVWRWAIIGKNRPTEKFDLIFLLLTLRLRISVVSSLICHSLTHPKLIHSSLSSLVAPSAPSLLSSSSQNRNPPLPPWKSSFTLHLWFDIRTYTGPETQTTCVAAICQFLQAVKNSLVWSPNFLLKSPII